MQQAEKKKPAQNIYMQFARILVFEQIFAHILQECYVTRHIWEPYMAICEDIRHTLGMKELYSQRKETIERIFGTAKENHGFRYTQMFGKVRMEMKAKWGYREERKTGNSSFMAAILFIKEKWLWCMCTRAALSTV